MKDLVELPTLENQMVWVNPKLIAAVEPVPASARTEAHVRIYLAGFKWSIKMPFDEFLKFLK